MANLLDRVMQKFMKHLDLKPNKSDSETRMNARAAGPKSTRAAGIHGRTAGKSVPRVHGRAANQKHSRISGLFHRGH
jgi:hypothetical protein